jgi:hypothetical protein
MEQGYGEKSKDMKSCLASKSTTPGYITSQNETNSTQTPHEMLKQNAAIKHKASPCPCP